MLEFWLFREDREIWRAWARFQMGLAEPSGSWPCSWRTGPAEVTRFTRLFNHLPGAVGVPAGRPDVSVGSQSRCLKELPGRSFL